MVSSVERTLPQKTAKQKRWKLFIQRSCYQWARQDSNLRSNGYASHFGFRRPFRVRGLDYPFTPAWGPAI
jgi:hypothetical protein